MAMGGGGNKEVVSDINVTPLCDIFVVLLIIFMVTANDANQQGPAIDLPQRIDPTTKPPDVKDQDECNVTVTKEQVYINGKPVTLTDLPKEFVDILPKTKDKQVMVRTEPEIPLERVVEIMGIAHANGAKGIGLGTALRPH